MAQNLIMYGYSGFNTDQRIFLEKVTHNLENCVIVFLEDGVIGTNQRSSKPYTTLQSRSIPLLCLKEDFQARGFSPEQIIPDIKLISYVELVDLIADSKRIISLL